MTRLRQLAALAGAVLAAVLPPLVTAAQDASGPVKQDMNFTPVLLGVGGVAVVVAAVIALRAVFRSRAAHGNVGTDGRELQKP